jgi:hypothetical protein
MRQIVAECKQNNTRGPQSALFQSQIPVNARVANVSSACH